MKNIVKSLLIVIIFLSAVSASAHQPDISTLTLIEQQPGKWMLQLNASMTAFQYEVRNEYGENSYASPEEFNQLLLKYLRAQITIQVNGEDVMLGNGLVQLGHATAVAFEVSGMPEVMEKVFIKNQGFENIYHSQIIFAIVQEGLDKSQFILNEANNYQLHVYLKDTQVLSAVKSWKGSWTILSITISAAMLFAFLMLKNNAGKKVLVSDNASM